MWFVKANIRIITGKCIEYNVVSPAGLDLNVFLEEQLTKVEIANPGRH